MKKKVFVGMSGGVDSSVAAALLRDEGYEVTGVFIKVWEAPFLPCTWREERRDAQRAAAHLSIPLLTLDLSAIYKKEVVDTFVAAYARGETPNPDVLCNKEVKFGAFYDFAMKEGADFIATGHYARKEIVDGRAVLLRSVDEEKDQTYFLWTIQQEVLKKTLFPIGHLKKSEVRTIARKHQLPNATKKDSQGICFLGDVDMASFLREFIPVEPGKVEDETGKVIGEHDGAILYTLGERHGLRIPATDVGARPWFVVGKDVTRNVLVVSHEKIGESTENPRFLAVDSWHTISGKSVEEECSFGACSVVFRYRQDPIPAQFDTASLLRLKLPRSAETVAPGQSAVLYRGATCLGGGIVTRIVTGS